MEARDPNDGLHSLEAELFERCEPVIDLDAAQIEGWVSGLFAAWDSDDDAERFVAHCAANPGPVAAALLAGIAYLADDALQRSARRSFDRMAGQAPEAIDDLGHARAGQAWSVDAPFGRSIVVGFRQGGDVIDHAVLAELDDDSALVDLAFSGPPHDLLEQVDDRSLAVTDLEAGEAMAMVAAAWGRSVDAAAEPSVGMLTNQRTVRRRLIDHGSVEADALGWFAADEGSVDLSRGMSDAEIAQANAAALGTLRAAVGDVPDAVPHDAWREVFEGRVDGMSPREREGLLWLEWADWLGAGIGMVRSTGDIELTPAVLVDFVNRCPEISSTIHANDRDYAEWAFALALEHLDDQGALTEGWLRDGDRAIVHASLASAWAPQDD